MNSPNTRNQVILLGLAATTILLACAQQQAGQRTEAGASLGVQTAAPSAPEFSTPEPTADSPVTAAFVCVASPQNADQYDVWIKIRTHEQYYLHAADDQHPNMIPVVAQLELPTGVKLLKPLQFPVGVLENEYLIYRGDLIVHGTIGSVSPDLVQAIAVSVSYQACTDKSCLPPTTIKLDSQSNL